MKNFITTITTDYNQTIKICKILLTNDYTVEIEPYKENKFHLSIYENKKESEEK